MTQGVPADPNRTEKSCTTCGVVKPLEEFHRDSKARDGRAPRCKVCANTAGKAFRSANPEIVAARKSQRRTRYAADSGVREDIKAKSREWRTNNPEKVAAQKARAKDAYVNDPERNREHWLRTYGLTPETYDELVAAQEGRCAICQDTCARYSSRLPIDHSHDTGQLRGLLCDRCNKILGLLKEDTGLLLASAEYLRSDGVIEQSRFVRNPKVLQRRRRGSR